MRNLLPMLLRPEFHPGLRRLTTFEGIFTPVDWNEDTTKFDNKLVLKASTFNPQRLFDVETVEMFATRSSRLAENKCALSSNGQFRYTEVRLVAGEWLDLLQGNRRGKVCFDGDVAIPRINEMDFRGEGFNHEPWMSLTPMEFLSQRYGVKRAKGHVVIAGLGMGMLLQKVAARKQVERITLVETSAELIEWIMPRLDLGNKQVTVVCGNARKVVPEMEADVALVDIFAGYGGNYFKNCPNIEYVWTWG